MDRFIRPQAMTKTRSQQLSEKADEQRRRCREWLLPFNHLVPSLSTLVRGRMRPAEGPGERIAA
jgi:hypothetical protein